VEFDMADSINDDKENKEEDGHGEDAVLDNYDEDDTLTQSTSQSDDLTQGTFENLQKLTGSAEFTNRTPDDKSFLESGPEISQFLKAEDHSNSLSESDEVLDSASVVHGVGHMLRNARLARKMSVEEVSRQLRISVEQVEAIEKENFNVLPGRTFVRGFVRNYANLMQLDATSIVQLLPGPTTTVSHIEHTPFKIQEMRPSSRDGRGPSSLVLIIVVLAFLAVVAFFLYQRMPLGQSTEEIKTDLTVQQKDGQASVELELPLPALNLSDKPEGATQFSQNVLSDLNSVSKINAFGTITLNFVADAHIKITDANNDIIFEQNNIRGSQQRVSGKRPLSIVISDASAVEVTYNDRAIDIKPYTDSQNGSAQLTLE